MFHPIIPPQPPPNLEASKPVYYLSSNTVIKVNNTTQKPIIDHQNHEHKYESPIAQPENSDREFS
ncbi:MAG: hypothetical protein ACKPGB_17895, partial [Dolichospermum sp.]